MIEALSPDEQESVAESAHIFAQKLFLSLESIYEKYSARS